MISYWTNKDFASTMKTIVSKETIEATVWNVKRDTKSIQEIAN